LVVAGAVGFAYHFRGPYDRDFAAIEAVRSLAVVGGMFLLMGGAGRDGWFWRGWDFMWGLARWIQWASLRFIWCCYW